MRITVLSLPLAALLTLSALAPAAVAGTPRLAAAGLKGDAAILIDLSTRKTEGTALAADALLVFPPPAPGLERPDHARVHLLFDCKARTIQAGKVVYLGPDDAVLREETPKSEPQPPVDPADARLLALACAETFPAADKTFASEQAAIQALRVKP